MNGHRTAAVIVATIAILVFAGAQVGISYVRSSQTQNRLDQTCVALEKVRAAVKDAQQLNRDEPLVAPADSPAFVTQILDQVNSRGEKAAHIALSDLRDASCS